MSNKLETSIRYLKGVGPKKNVAFNNLGIYTINDLIQHYPRDYQDRTVITKITNIDTEQFYCVEGVILSIEQKRFRTKLTLLKVLIDDGSNKMYCTWFNQDYLKEKLKVGRKYIFYGKPIKNSFLYEINSPEFSDDKVRFMNIVPIYKKNGDLTQNYIRKCVKVALETSIDEYIEILPQQIKEKYDLIDYKSAIKNIHFPNSNPLFFKARKRLVFNELFILQLVLFKLKEGIKNKNKFLLYKKDTLFEKLVLKLPYQLTNAQNKVIAEITRDLYSEKLMNRIVQGDVGSGKTIVAIAAIVKTFENGYQSAFMAPTEILAKQHYINLKELLDIFNIKIAFLSSGISKKEKEQIINKISEGEIDLVIGTHALIQKDIKFIKLGLVITDEQHRFGVEQRALLSKKGDSANVLVMTATPIPRTLALILYGDLDVSIIDEMPVGREKIETFVVNENKRSRINEFIKKRIEKKEQGFIVCPTIEQSETLSLKNVYDVYKESEKIFNKFKVAMLHGKMKSKEKNDIMEQFRIGKIDILVSTTVIEVGVDVKNATLMIIENANRFGIAQLHQLRGRVGRGNKKSYCVLYDDGNSSKASKRLSALEQSNDGYFLSEQDLILRGPGDFFGTKQHGLPELKISNLYNDVQILKIAQKEALRILEEDSEMQTEQLKYIKSTILLKLKEVIIE